MSYTIGRINLDGSPYNLEMKIKLEITFNPNTNRVLSVKNIDTGREFSRLELDGTITKLFSKPEPEKIGKD